MQAGTGKSELLSELMKLACELDTLKRQSGYMGNSRCTLSEDSVSHGQQAYYQGASFAFETAQERLCQIISKVMAHDCGR